MTVRKRYRVTIEVTVEMEEVSRESVLAYLGRWRVPDNLGPPIAPPPLPSEADIAAQRALQEALMKDPELLDRWLRRMVVLDMPHWFQEEDAGPDPKLLHPAIDRLAPRYRHWWRQSLLSGDDDLFERTDGFYDSVRINPGPAMIAAVDLPGS